MEAAGVLIELSSKEKKGKKIYAIGAWLQSIGATYQAVGATREMIESGGESERELVKKFEAVLSNQ